MDSIGGEISRLISQTTTLCCFDEIHDLEPDPSLSSSSVSPMLVGKLVADKVINKNSVRSIIMGAWNLANHLSITFLAPNTFLFGFSNEDDCSRIFSSGPWFIRGLHLVLKEWSSGLVLEEINFNFSPFWVQVHGLPPEFKTSANGLKIGPSIGCLLEVDALRVGHLVWSKFIRIKVGIDVQNPLKTGFLLK
ncbi:hypothetical protein L1049_025848 [Liquidambar formosana]|uniref:DUF4283 domain-containing protein n=1 Tax=Liquidambar formosana TaxID=63359 RepID=A0AAP0R8P6_LIQFO